MDKMFSEWFGSEGEARSAGRRVEAAGYVVKVRYAMRADGRHDWLLEAF